MPIEQFQTCLVQRYESDIKQDQERKKELMKQLAEVERDIQTKRMYCREIKGKEVS